MPARATRLAPLAALLLAAACNGTETLDLDGDGGPPGTDDTTPLHLDAVDALLVIDDSISMAQEQGLLATSLFHLVNSLTLPPSGWPYAPVDDVRIAVVTSNMGLSADGEPGDAYWPTTVPASCTGTGEGGSFQSIDVAAVAVVDGAIPCHGAEGECPPGWGCATADGSTEPRCLAGDAGPDVECPELAGEWAESSAADPNALFSTSIACLSTQGTSGCGFEQQLAAAAAATSRADQAAFFRGDAALAVIVVTDEDDCSLDDAVGMFGTDEVQHQSAGLVNVACGRHPEYLHTAEHYRERLAAAKGGEEDAVIFAAIAGVPPGPACEGAGSSIGGCLALPGMQLVEEEIDSLTYYRAACDRWVGGEQVTKAYPARRLVDLAIGMGENGYAFSICNESWIPAMESIAGAIARVVQEH